MDTKYIRFEDLEWKNTLTEDKIDPKEKKRIDNLIEQLRTAIDEVCERLDTEGRYNP